MARQPQLISPAAPTRPAQVSGGLGARAQAQAFEDLARAAGAITNVAQQHEQFALQATVSKTRRDFDKRALELQEQHEGDVDGYQKALDEARASFIQTTDGRFARSVDEMLKDRAHGSVMAMAERRLANTREEAQEAMAIETARSRAELETFVETNGAQAFLDPRFEKMVGEYNAIIDTRRDSGHERFSPERADYEKKSLFDTLQVLAAKPEIDAAYKSGGAAAAFDRAAAIAADPDFELNTQDRDALQNKLVAHASFLERKESARIAEINARNAATDRAVRKRADEAEVEMLQRAIRGELTPEWLLKNRDLDGAALSKGYTLVTAENKSPVDEAYALDLRRRARAGEDIAQETATALAAGRINLSYATSIDEEAQAAKNSDLKEAMGLVDAGFKQGQFSFDNERAVKGEEAQIALREWYDRNPEAGPKELNEQARALVRRYQGTVYVDLPTPIGGKPKDAADVERRIENIAQRLQDGKLTEDEAARQLQILEQFEKHFQEQVSDE